MSGNVDTIKSFLVSLGFDVDGAGQARFEATIKGVTASVIKMGAAVEGAALAVVGFTTQIANGLDKLYWASQRTGATVNGIKALGYAASQTGASAEAAQNSLESLAAFMRNNPGAEGFLNRLGVQTRDASGKLRDTAAIFTGVGQRLNNMPYYRARQYAQMLGIDENTLMAMRRGMSGFSADYQSMLQKTGFNADKAAAQSNKFMTSMRGLTSLFGIMRDKIGSNLADGLAGSLDGFRRRILDNFPKIEETLTRVIKGVLWLAEAFSRMVYRLVQGAGAIIDWWKRLDDGSKNLLKIFGAILVAWRLLNSAFMTSPVGIITSLIIALGLLWDDYQTWKEGGKSLIDWSKWEPAIEKAKKAITWLRDKLLGLNDAVGGWQESFELLATFIAGAWVSKVLGAFGKIAGLPIPPWLKLWGLYAGYLISDSDNITASAKSSWSTTKSNVGDALRWLGFDTDLGQREGTVHGNNIQPDIPGAEPLPGSTIADRQNNPGNLRPIGGSGFTTHKTPLDGWMAMARQIRLYFTGKSAAAGYQKLQTIWDIVHKYAPKEDNNDPAGYANFVASMMGVGAKDTLNLSDPQQFSSLLQAMSRKEGYGQWNSPLASVAASQAAAQISQETNINIYGATDPSATGREVADRQMGVNSRLTQQMAGPG
ncbi:lytic transglycosylase catalytic [Atlantibacter hermannii]|uniref:lytic transglycosylase catalytic n=1 Tax=Atlantibacter hermannii TaxID=565 RepID=UPI002FD8B7CD